jgi:GAF domain-containing protein
MVYRHGNHLQVKRGGNMTLRISDMEHVMNRIEAALDSEPGEPLQIICQLLKDEVEHYDWVGFYLVDRERDRQLVLGPYAGEPTEHTNIAFGQGICGQAADTGKLFLIQDVSKETNYLSCSPTVKSEIVLPIFKDGALVGELDIDSHQLEPFNDLDTELLQRVCDFAASFI